VIAHVDQGIQADVVIEGVFDLWWDALKYYGPRSNWTRADYKTIGWLDTSGNFTTWLATPLADRNDVELSTPDARIMAYVATREGPITHMTTVEMQLIKAEGMLRTAGPSPAVVGIINATRVGNGQLAPATTGESQSDMMDKLIYEKRIEGFLLCGGCAFFDRRGFGPLAPTGPAFHQGLVEGTPLHFPIPGQELERLGLPYYTFGGIGTEMAEGAAVQHVGRVAASDIYRFGPAMTGDEMLAYVRSELRAATRARAEQGRTR
jgi:hypothetical protein